MIFNVIIIYFYFINVVETTSFRRLALAVFNGVSCNPTPSSTVTITVDDDRNLNITTSDADNTICSSDAITFTGQNFQPGDTFRWLLNSVPIGGATNSVYNAAAGSIPNGAEVVFEATTAGGSCVYTASVTINVASDPIASIGTNAPGDTICSGQSISITASPTGLSYSFSIWGVPANPADVVGNVLTTTGITTDTIVSVTVTNATGCSDTASLTVLVPYIINGGDISDPGVTICPGDSQPEISSASLAVAAGASGAATMTYQWQYKVGAGAWQVIAGQTSSVL